MSNKLRIALSLAVLLGTASGAAAATKHQKHRHSGTTIERRIPQDPYGAYGMATQSRYRGGIEEARFMAIQASDYRTSD